MDINTIWSGVLSALLGALWFFIREKLEDVKRLERLLNITREEIARDTATKAEVARVKELISVNEISVSELVDKYVNLVYENS